jgi:nucleoid-associated protein YgaU
MPIDKKDQDAARRALEEWRKTSKRPQKFMAEHTVKEDETLSHIALKYYGSAIKEKWMVIYEANKDVIGDNPNVVVPGQVLKIPEL